MFTKKRIIITVISAVLVAALAVGAVFIAGGISGTPIENIVDSEAANADGNGDTTEKNELPIISEESDKTNAATKEEVPATDSFSSQSSILVEGGTEGIYKETADEYKLPENYVDTSVIRSVKQNMPDEVLKIDGESIVFSYSHTEKKRMTAENLDGKEVYVGIDYYTTPKGYTANKYEGDDGFRYFSKSDYSASSGTNLSKEAIQQAALKIVENTDITIEGAASAKKNIRESGSRYNVTYESAKGKLSITLGTDGSLKYIIAENYATASEASKNTARQKMQAYIDVRNEAKPDTKWVLDDEKYIQYGKKVYAFFSAIYYPDPQSDNPTPETDACSVYSFFCEV